MIRTVHLVALLVAPAVAGAQAARTPVVYEISFPNAAHHEATVSATFPDLPARPLEVRMSRSSPGRYALHEFAKNVYGVKAFNSKGRELRVEQVSPHQWSVAGHDGTVRVTYTVFGDRVDGTYLGIDNTHAHLNMPATFVWSRAHATRPIRVTFRPPNANWKVATQLSPTSDALTFTAPHLQYFMDSPTEVGAFDLHSWTERSGTRSYTIRLALHHTGSAADATRYVDMAKRVVSEAEGVFGEMPQFDYGTYTFIADYLPWASGDGMEHRNSTILSSSNGLATGAQGLLGTLSHEFFHAWNVERIRPRSLEPFDFSEANMSGELWLAEGFTSYYGPLLIARAGITSPRDYARSLSGTVNTVLNAPGRRFFGPVGMSRQAPFVDAAVSIDPQNKQNTFISYYTYGAGLGLALDLALRNKFPNLTLDHLMRELWRAYGKGQSNFTPERSYTLDDVRQALLRVTNDAAFTNEFYERYITGSSPPDFRWLLAKAGFLVTQMRPGQAWLGDAPLRFDSTGATITSATLIDQPLYVAGLDRGDIITSLGGRAIRTQGDLDTELALHQPGASITIGFTSRDGPKQARVVLGEDPRVEVMSYEDASRTVTDEMRRFRERWLASRAAPE